jgi:hypothetical protein
MEKVKKIRDINWLVCFWLIPFKFGLFPYIWIVFCIDVHGG